MSKITVIIPTYNQAQYLSSAIKSILNQTYKDFEIIVVDDGSTDSTKEMVNTYIKRYPSRIQYFYQEHKGPAAARNKALQQAKGDYVAFLDADDMAMPKMLEVMVSYMKKYDAVKPSSYKIFLDSDHKVVERTISNASFINRIDNLYTELLKSNITGGIPGLVKRVCFEKTGLFDEKLTRRQDWEMWIRIAKFGFKIYGLAEPLYIYRKFDNGYLPKSKILRAIKGTYIIIGKYRKEAFKIDRNFRKIYAQILWNNARMALYEGKSLPWTLKCLFKSLLYNPNPKRTFKSLATFLKGLLGTNSKRLEKTHNVMYVHGNSNIIGGQELSLLQRIQGLKDRGLHPIVLIPERGIFSELLSENSIEVRYIKLNRFNKKNPIPFIKTVIAIYRLIKKDKISIIHCSGVYPTQYCLPAARLCRIPCVTHINSTVYSKYDLKSSFIKYTDSVITVAQEVAEKIIRLINIDRYKVVTVYNPIVSNQSNNHNNTSVIIKEMFGFEEDIKLVGQIGQIIPRKGLEYFVRMAGVVKRAYPQVKFLIVGSPTDKHYERYIKKLAEDLKLTSDVIFTGFQKDIQAFINILDVSVLASLEEGLARVAVESLYLEKPVVSTAVSGMPEVVVNNKTGLLVPPKDPEALAEAVLRLLNNPKEAEKFGKNGKEFVLERFSIDRHTKSILNIYRSLLNGQSKNKILFYEPSPGFGGSGSALVNNIEYLDKDNFYPIVVIKNYGAQFARLKGRETIQLRDYREPLKLSNLKFLFFFIKNIIPQTIKLYLIIKRKRVSLLHINTNIILGIPAIIASKIAGIPCICHIRQTRELIKRERVFSKWVDKFIVLNKDAYKMYKMDIPDEKLHLIYDGIDLNKHYQAEERKFKQEFNLDSAPIIGTVGRIVQGKGQKEFILAAKEVLRFKPNAKFVIVGDAPEGNADYYRELKKLAEKENINGNVLFTGWRNDVKDIIPDLDIFVFTSTTYPEGLPNTIIEAMALRKPVVATNIPGPSDIVINGKTGFLVSPGDTKAMAEKIIYLLDNQEIAKRMGAEGRKRAEELFDIKKQVKEIEKIYEKVLS